MAKCMTCGRDAGYLHSVCESCRPQGQASPGKEVKFRENPLSLGASDKDGRDSPLTWLVGMVVVGIFAFMVVMRAGCTPQAKDKQIKRMAIEDCWKEYERKSLDPPTRRFVASACEKMEVDFKASYGVEP